MLARHDFVPDFVLPTVGGTPARLYGIAGGERAVVAFLASAPSPAWPANLRVHTVHRRPPPGAHAAAFVDPMGALWKRCAGESEAVAFVVSENLRVLEVLAGDPATWPDAAAMTLAIAAPPVGHAPVLLIPDVVDAAFCAQLIRAWDADNAETGVERSADAGRANELAAELKRRRDHTVGAGELFDDITRRLSARIRPEVRKAMSFDATRFEGFKIGCYESEHAGFFRRHRDNLSPATQHRRFALSLNLNDDYDGGALCFPEYGDMHYRPPLGGAIVFSGSLLHEALPVTRGRRFVLLSFLYGAQDQRRTPRSGR